MRSLSGEGTRRLTARPHHPGHGGYAVTSFDALNKLAKWRNVFASWQLGTRLDNDGECRAVKDHRELSILMRAELSALTGLLIKKGVISQAGFEAALVSEAGQLDQDYERKFPGFSTDQDGVHMQLPEARETMRRLGFPQ